MNITCHQHGPNKARIGQQWAGPSATLPPDAPIGDACTESHSRLQRIENWLELAQRAKYSVALLAKLCKVSARTIDRFSQAASGMPPGRWLKNLRMRRALELLLDGSSVKETANELHYDPSHFSRQFKKHYGLSPRRAASLRRKRQENDSMSHSAMKCRVSP